MKAKCLIKKIHRDEKGMALIWAMILLVFTTVLAVAIYRLNMSNSKMVVEQSKDISSYYIAESGIEMAEIFLNKTIVDENGTRTYELTQTTTGTPSVGKRLADLANASMEIKMIDVIPYIDDKLVLGSEYSQSGNKLYLPEAKNKATAEGEVYVTIEADKTQASSGTVWIKITSIGTYYIGNDKVETSTAVMKIDANNHNRIEREYEND